ncbi:phosphate ABC transporter permease PstC, partial [Gluconacetobacter sacchari]
MQRMPRSPDLAPVGRNEHAEIGDRMFAGLVRLCGWLMLALLGGLIAVLAWGGVSAWSSFGPGFVWSTV